MIHDFNSPALWNAGRSGSSVGRCRRVEALLEPSAPLGAGDQANPRGSMLPDHVSCPALLFPDLVELYVKLRDPNICGTK